MKSQVKPLRSLSRQELVAMCNEVMVCAARDLAEFTKKGLFASEIVSLALKCEEFEQVSSLPGTPVPTAQSHSLENEIRKGLLKICEIGRSIWQRQSPKYQDYLIPAHIHEGLASASTPSTSSNVA